MKRYVLFVAQNLIFEAFGSDIYMGTFESPEAAMEFFRKNAKAEYWTDGGEIFYIQDNGDLEIFRNISPSSSES